MPDTVSPISDRRLKLASEYFLGGRLAMARAGAEQLWLEGQRDPALATLHGELMLLSNRLGEAAEAIQCALETQPGQPRLIGLRTEIDRRAGRLASAAAGLALLGRQAQAARLAVLAQTGAYRLPEGAGSLVLDWSGRAPLPSVVARVGGGEAHLLLDTGVGDCLLDTALARRLDLPVFGSESIQFPAGPPGQVELAILPELTLGDLSIGQVPIQIMPLRELFADLADRPVDGILGTGLLSRFSVTIDYAEGRLCLARGEQLADGSPLYLAGEHYPLLEARINERLDALLFLDTGLTGAAFALPATLAEPAGVEPLPAVAAVGFGMSQALTAQAVRIESLVAAGARGHQLTGMLMGRFRLERPFGFRIAGLLGADFIAKRALTLDFQRMRVRIAPDGAPLGSGQHSVA